MAHHSPLTFHDYDAGHPWHYFLGGPVRSPKAIWDATVAGGVRGYRRDEIEAAALSGIGSQQVVEGCSLNR